MHSAAIEARLKSNRLAYAHFQMFKSVYKGYAQSALEFYSKYPKMDIEARAKTVREMILQLDPNI
jgi:hypothetical protein